LAAESKGSIGGGIARIDLLPIERGKKTIRSPIAMRRPPN